MDQIDYIETSLINIIEDLDELSKRLPPDKAPPPFQLLSPKGPRVIYTILKNANSLDAFSARTGAHALMLCVTIIFSDHGNDFKCIQR